ncbi:cytosol aminopeptidase [Bacillaceae bacterium]
MIVELKEGDAASYPCDCLVLFALSGGETPAVVKEIDGRLGSVFAQMREDETWTGKKKETVAIHALGKLPAKWLLFVGLGVREELKPETIREAAARAVKEAQKLKAQHVAFAVASLADAVSAVVETKKAVHALVEGSKLAAYRFAGYKRKNEGEKDLERCTLLVTTENKTEAKEGLRTGEAVANGVLLARDLVNTPANLLTPAVLAERAQEVARRHGLECQVLEKDEMERLGMGGLLGVAQGSTQPPKLIVMKYTGDEKGDRVLGLIGKGVTFDSGGICLKPAQGMEEMKGDMGGAATVIGAMDAIATLKLPVNVLAVIPATENMPSGSALKPGDVIETMSKKTVEILNTDAEGRLILADAVTYAKKLGANYLVDLATLTGAVLIALGTCTTGAIANDEGFLNMVLQAAEEAGERCWPLPSFDPYKEMIKSSIADLRNTGGTRYAGAITGGLFIGAFAEETPWVHLDIAGTAWAEKGSDLSPKGGTGVMVPTLVHLARRLAENGCR